MPLELVFTVMVLLILLKVPLAPEAGAVKVTLALLMGLLAASFTITDRAVPKAVEIVVDCVPPPLMAIEAGT